MKFYKNTNNQVFAYEADGSQDAFISDTLIAITEIEANELLKPAPPTIADLTEAVRSALQEKIDERAKAYGFSSGNALMLYAGFVNHFQPLAQTFAVWESTVWAEAEAYKSDVLAGLKPMLSPQQAVALMPAYPL